MTDVRPAVGQVWKDNDPRIEADRGCARLLLVTAIEGDRAVCEAWYDEPGSAVRMVRIQLSRFRPTSTGYTFVRDASGVSA